MHTFTNEQKARIGKVAREAYEAWEGLPHWAEQHAQLKRTASFELWRHTETAKVTGGISSLRECVSELHYLPLLAHFSDIAGRGGAALQALLRHGEAARITPFYKLQQALAERGLDESYAAAICRRQFKCALGDASEKQLWSLFYTIRNRRKVAQVSERRPAPKKVTAKLGTLRADTSPAPAADPIARLEARMAAAVRAENYELAARLRDEIAHLRQPELVENPF